MGKRTQVILPATLRCQMTDNCVDLAEYFLDHDYAVTVIPVQHNDGRYDCSVVALEPHPVVLPTLTTNNLHIRTRALIAVAIASHAKLSEHNLTFRTHIA